MLSQALSRLLDFFPESRLKQAVRFVKQEDVLNIRLSDGLLHARIKGQGKAGYLFDVYMDLKTWPQIPARCTCEAAPYCEHIAASILALRLRAAPQQAALKGDERFETWMKEATSENVLIPKVLEPIQVIEADEVEWYSQVNELEDGFFTYELGILIDDRQVSLVPLIVELLHQYTPVSLATLPDTHLFQLPLTEHQVLSISMGRLKLFFQFLLNEKNIYAPGKKTLQLHRYQWMILQEAVDASQALFKRTLTQAAFVKQLQTLCNYQQHPETPLPPGFTAQLRPYQQKGLDWLQALSAAEMSGILADDMGLGKTVQTLAHLMVEKEANRLNQPVLIVAPLSLVGNWATEAERFTPSLRVLVFHGTGRSKATFSEYDIVISTYGLIQRDKAFFLKHTFYYLILDEAQYIKNARTKTTLSIQQLKAAHRLCLSGTPFENHLGELWSLFHFLMPGLLGDKRQFRRYFQYPIEKEGDNEKRNLLMKRIAPFLLRRTKQQVAQELPEKTEVVYPVSLLGAQRDLYETIRISMEKRVREAIAKQGLAKSQLLFLDALLKLRQVCCDPRLVSLPVAKAAHGVSAKLMLLMDLIETLVDEGRVILIFSQFTSMLALIEEAVKEKGYAYLKLTGKTKSRQALVERFQEGGVPLFLISLKAGGVGLNLTRADTVIHYDPWWNPAVEDQATDRTHRIGQVNPVFVYRLVAEGTVEEAISRMQARKRLLFDGILSNQTLGVQSLTEEDIAVFFKALDAF